MLERILISGLEEKWRFELKDGVVGFGHFWRRWNGELWGKRFGEDTFFNAY